MSSANIVTIQKYLNTLQPILESIFDNETLQGKKSHILGNLFDIVGSKLYTETMLSDGDVSQPTEFTGSIDFQTTSEAYKTTATVVEYATGIIFQRILMETCQYKQVINNKVPKMVRKCDLHDEILRTNVFNNAGTTASYTGGDGVALGSSAHPVPSGLFTQSNITTSTFSLTTIKTGINAMVNYKDYVGDILDDVTPTHIVVGTKLAPDAEEYVKSSYKPNSGDNNENPYANGVKGLYRPLEVLMLRHLTSQTQWFLIDINAMKRAAVHFKVVETETNTSVNFTTLAIMFSLYNAGMVSCRAWPWIYVGNAS